MSRVVGQDTVVSKTFYEGIVQSIAFVSTAEEWEHQQPTDKYPDEPKPW